MLVCGLCAVFGCSLSESLVTARATDILEGMLQRGFTTVRDAGVHGKVQDDARWRPQDASCLVMMQKGHGCSGTIPTKCSGTNGTPYCSSACHQSRVYVWMCAGGADWGLAEAVEEGSILGPSVLFVGAHCNQNKLVILLHCSQPDDGFSVAGTH